MPKTCKTPKCPVLRLLFLVFIAAVLSSIATPVVASTSGGGSDASWGAFFGRTHILFLHLPIGLLAGAFVIEFFGFFKRSRGFDIAAAWLFVLGAGGAVFTVITGMLYGTEWAADNSGKEPMSVWQLLFADSIEDGVTETLGWHMWLGITLMVAAIFAAVFKVMAVRRQWRDTESAIPERGGWPLGVSRLALIGAMAAMPFAGHLGGNMAKTPEYLFERAPFGESVPRWVVVWPEPVESGGGGDTDAPPTGDSEEPDGSVAAWVNVIQPAMNSACVKCHGPSKKNGGIRLDTLKHATEGDGLDYAVIEPGDAQFSSLYVVITLPKSHDMFMPPDPKDAFDQETIEFIGEWLQNYDGRLEDPEPVKEDTDDSDSQDKPEVPKPVIDPAALQAITAAGGNAQSLSQEENPDLLTVKFAYLATLDTAAVAKLESGKDNIAWLTFEGSAFGDEAAKALPDMAKLERLNLKDSAITDAGLAELPKMPVLNWLNLFGTEVTDAGLESLKEYGTLKKLYLTGTKVSAEGVNKLREAMPDTEVFSDHDGAFQFTPATPEAEGEGDKAAVKPLNDKCPVTGAPVKPGFVSTFEGKTVGFCCNNCKAQFDADPNKFKAKLQ